MMLVAAAMLSLTFTVPHSVNPLTHYVAQRCNSEFGCVPANVYSSAALAPTVPNAQGTLDTVWISVTTDPNAPFGSRRGGQMIQIAGVTALGDSGKWSNGVILAASCRDTNWTDTGGFGWRHPDSGVVRFSRPIGQYDYSNGPLLCQEDVQRLHWDAICAIYHYVCLAGQRTSCGLVGP